MRRSLPRAGFALLLILAVSVPVAADTVHLKNGNSLHGKIVREDEKGVEIRLEHGTVFLRWSSVRSVERTRPPAELLKAARRALERGNEEEALEFLRRAGRHPSLAGRARDEAWTLLAARFDRHFEGGRLALARRTVDALRRSGAPASIAANRASVLDAASRRIEASLAAVPDFRAEGRHDEIREALEAGFLAFPARRQELGRDLAATLVLLGERAFATDPAEASEFYDRALLYNPRAFSDLADHWAASRRARSAKLLDAGRHADAVRLLRETVDAHPLHRKALYALGEAHRKGGDPAEAFAAFAALAGETRDYEPTLLARVRVDARRVADAWSGTPLPGPVVSKKPLEKWTEHFIVVHRCEAAFARALGGAAEYHLRRIWRALGGGKDLEAHWLRPARLVVFEDPDAYRRVHPLSEASMAHMYLSVKGGELADHGVRMMQTSPVRTGPVLPHEIGHLVFHALTRYRPNLPLWMHEGFALWCEPATRKPYMRLHARFGVLAGESFPLAGFLTATAYPAERIDLYYCQAFSLIEFLEARGSLRRLVESASRPVGDAEALAGSLGFRDVKELAERWKVWVRKGTASEDE
jgi:tetratricopeptide (TPR) repeat protein